MASKLKAINPTLTNPMKPRVLLSGPAGVGKTFFSLDFPNCYYEDHEGGATQREYVDKLTAAGGMYFGREHGALDFAEVINQAKALATEKHDFKTVINDSITKLLAVSQANEADRIEASGKKNEFSADKKAGVASLRKLLNWYTKLDMTVIMIAHQKEEWAVEGGERKAVGTTFDAWDKLAYELDIWLEFSKQGPKRVFKVRKSRIKTFEEGKSYTASYETFAELYGKSVIDRQPEPIQLASPEQVSEIIRLVDLMKIDQTDTEKWLLKANADNFSDFSVEIAAKTLDFLNSKLKGLAA